VLLLGAGRVTNSSILTVIDVVEGFTGKSTFFKQLRLIHGQAGYDEVSLLLSRKGY
jgi:hypothetical protein